MFWIDLIQNIVIKVTVSRGKERMRICLIYDPCSPTASAARSVGTGLAGRLADAGHQVTYVTMRQWPKGEPDGPTADVVAVGPMMANYRTTGARTMLPPILVFGLGVLLHLLRHGRRYDVVHTASFPYFSLLAAALARPSAAIASPSTGSSSGPGPIGAAISAGWAGSAGSCRRSA